MTTTVRSVRVELDASISAYVAKMQTAGQVTDSAFGKAETRIKSTNKELGKSSAALSDTSRAARGLEGNLTRLESKLDGVAKVEDRIQTSVSAANRKISEQRTELGRTEQATRRASNQLDSYSGRTGILLKLLAGFGPALLPISAVGIPAIAGLTAQLGAGAGALGTVLLALVGVKDALTDVEKARLDPTVDNLQAMHDSLTALGPDAGLLVTRLEQLRGVGNDLRQSAAAGLFPGVLEALDDLETKGPQAERLLREIGDATGDITARGAKSLTSERYTAFFDYLQTTARPILDDTADAVGHVAHGIASLLVGTRADQLSFTGWLADVTKGFDDFATGADSNQKLQDFLAYAREAGPEVADAVVSIASALASVAEAAAPLGGPTLQIISSLADVIDSIASSPIGTPVFAAISAYSLLSTVLPGVKKGYDGIATGQSKFEAQIGKGRTAVTTFAGDLRNVARYGSLATESSARLKTQLGPLVKGGLGLAGLAIATSGAADGLGLTNTASLALMGTLAGPWGAAVGAGVGLIKDFSAGSDDAGKATSRWNAQLKSGQTSLETYGAILAQARDQLSSADDIIPTSFGDQLKSAFNPQNIKLNFKALFGDLNDTDLGKQADEVAQLNNQYGDLITTAQIVGQTLGEIPAGQSGTMAQLTEVLTNAKPAMDALGISTEDLVGAMQDGSILGFISRIESYQRLSDGSVGTTQQLSEAISGLDDDFLSSADAATTLQTALDKLLNPQLNLSQATDEYTSALRHLGDDLDKSNRSLAGNSDAALKNRDAIRQRVSQLEDVLTAEAGAGASSTQLVRKLKSQRQALIDAGAAAGVSRKDMKQYLDTLGLTPNLVNTLITNNADNASAKANHYINELLRTPRQITTYIDVYRRTHGGSLQGQKDNPALADGGEVPGQRAPYGDKILIAAAPGEHVITNRNGEADRFRADRAAGRIPAYAGGGTVGDQISTYVNRRQPGGDYQDGSKNGPPSLNQLVRSALAAGHAVDDLKFKTKAVERAMDRLEKASDKVKDSYDKQKSTLDDLRSSRADIASSVAGSYVKDPFGNGLAGFDAQTDADSSDLSAMEAALATLQQNGLAPGSALYQAIAASADVNTAQQFAQLTAGDLASRAQRFTGLRDQSAVFGGSVADNALTADGKNYVEAIRHGTKETRELKQEMHELAREIRDLPTHTKKAVKEGAHDGAKSGSEEGTKAGNTSNDGTTASRARTVPAPRVKRR